jgi:hypothetical protein
MPSTRFDWHERIRAVENEYRSVRVALDRLILAEATEQGLLPARTTPASLGVASANLEGTYLVRLFAEFESALRSYDRSRRGDPTLMSHASTLIDTIGGRRGHGIPNRIRQRGS